MMDYGSIVPLRPAFEPSSCMRLWKSHDSEPFLFFLDTPLCKAGTEVLPVDPHGKTVASAPPTGGSPQLQPKPQPSALPGHLQTDAHRLAHVKGVLWGAAHKMAGIQRKTLEGGGGITSKEVQDFSELRGLKDRMSKISTALENAGIKDLPQHHQDLQQHWQANPGARSGAVGANLHLDAATMSTVHSNLASAQPGPAPVSSQPSMQPMPMPVRGSRGRVGPPSMPPTPTTAGHTQIPAGPHEPTMVTSVPAPLPALGTSADEAPPTFAEGTAVTSPGKPSLMRSLQLVEFMQGMASA